MLFFLSRDASYQILANTAKLSLLFTYFRLLAFKAGYSAFCHILATSLGTYGLPCHSLRPVHGWTGEASDSWV